MPITRYARFADEVIARVALDTQVGYLRSDRYPTLRLRYLKDRKRGVWDVLSRHGWRRVGNYPELDCSTMLMILPGVVEHLKRGFAVGVSASSF